MKTKKQKIYLKEFQVKSFLTTLDANILDQYKGKGITKEYNDICNPQYFSTGIICKSC